MSILPRFFGLAGADAAGCGRVPEGLRVYAIGDIHGRADLLESLAEQVAADARGCGRDTVTVFTGDFIDRGPQSRAVLDRLAAQRFPTPIRPLQGNHETMLLAFLENPALGPMWFQNGGAETLVSYGVDPLGGGLPAVAQAFRERLPPEHLALLGSLPTSLTIGDYFFCHAGVRPGVPLDCQSVEDLTWIRGEFLRSTVDFGKIIVHGHNPSREPEIRPNRIGIDTGAYCTGRLTCLVLDGAERRFLSTGA